MVQSGILFSLLALPLALAAPSHSKRAITPVYNGGTVSGQTFDYVIAGGGLAGVVLASRLTEDSNRRVLVIESGYDEEGRTDVTDASKYQSTFNTFLDWAYQTVPQTSANNEPTTVRAGRALGGSTTINGLAWSKPHSFQIDAMETVGNAGLNWNSLQTYMRRAENFQPPSASQAAAGVTFSGACHASGGPIGVQYDPNSSPSDLERNLNTTIKNFGVPYAGDLTCGNPAGLAPVSNTRQGNTRIDAYRGYLFGKTRPNLTVLAGANVGKVILSSGSNPRATGVEFRDETGATYSVNARLEVIMATGSIKTPLILQQSGIGPASFLSAANVPLRVDLPIGQNLIDQTTTTTSWTRSGNSGGGQPIVFPRFQDLVSGPEATTMRNMLQNDLGTYAQAAVDNGAAPSAAALQRVLEIQRDWILNQNAGVSENFDYSYASGTGAVLGYDSWYLLPFGRGSVRINSNQPYSNQFSIDPRFFSNPFDRLAQGATARFTRKASTSAPLSQQVPSEITPGSAVPNGASLEAWSSWAQNNYRSNWHPIGTVAMMSKDLGGSVDSRYRVYGVAGLRVVDGSTLPFQVSSHLMSVLYGFAERAAEFIRADNNGAGPTSSSSASTSTSSSASSSTASPTVTGRAIHPNGDNAKCLEVRDGATSDGTQVVINDCNNSQRQRWTIARGSTAVQLAGTTKCLDAGSNPGNGVQMKIWTCYAGIPAQTWYFTDDNYIAVQGGNQCLDLTGGSKTNGNVVQTWQCSSNNNNQKWTV